MSEDGSSQYALTIAVNTLKERCKHFQEIIEGLEKENTKLKIQCKSQHDTYGVSSSDVEELKEKVIRLTEQKAKLRRDMVHIAAENRDLWSKLSKILEINKSLGGRLNKINDSLNEHGLKKTLVRSTTFTQSDVDAKNVNKAIEENHQISLELEDVSLKLISNIVKEKNVLESQCTEMTEIQKSIYDSLGFAYQIEDSDETFLDNFEQHITDLKNIKEKLTNQNLVLEKNLNEIESAYKSSKDKRLNYCDKADVDEEIQLQSLARWGTPENSNTFLQEKTEINKCPMCSEEFPAVPTSKFVEHVENHFKL